jgi:uncharacterized protein YkwD
MTGALNETASCRVKKIVVILGCYFASMSPVLEEHVFDGSVRSAYGESRDVSAGRKVVELVNAARGKGSQCGARYHKPVGAVRWNDALGEVSLKHSLHMAGNGEIGHSGGDGSDTGVRIAGSGYRWVTYGENVGEGYLAPEDAVNAWLKSKRHCENIMNPAFREAGAASAKNKDRTYWTLVLATPEPSSHISP